MNESLSHAFRQVGDLLMPLCHLVSALGMDPFEPPYQLHYTQ